MTMNPLPPQAYTKETLVKAYAWLQNQNDHIKELASNTDVLVSLYLRAKLQGEAALERPSIQNFKNELRNLAGMMGEFEAPAAPAPAPASKSVRHEPQAPQFDSTDTKLDLKLDMKSQSLIQEVKIQLNLSSDAEALRLLIAVGHNQVKALIK